MGSASHLKREDFTPRWAVQREPEPGQTSFMCWADMKQTPGALTLDRPVKARCVFSIGKRRPNMYSGLPINRM